MKVVTSIFSDPVWTLPPAEVDRLRRRFPRLDIVDAPSRAERASALPGADVAFLSQLTAEEYALAPTLRWIQSPAAGVAGLLFPALRESAVVLTNARGLHGEAIAEHVVGLIIVLFRQIHRAIRAQATHSWDKGGLDGFRTLRGRRLGLVGLGAIGATIADRAAALGMDVVAVRRQPGAPRPASVSAVYPPSGLATMLAQADVVVIAAPLTPATRGLIGEAELSAMKRDAILINVARGKLVREGDLADALARGAIAGAALDVVEHEPLDPGSPLWDLPNVVITPHTSGFRQDYWTLAADLFAENLARFERGDTLLNVVDKLVGY